ncbi:thioredoxin-like protein [Lipomyces chichibuensis]|uniref:thioredoxin-like protein n=1 Tax=Lipomyces chichibuensis TaxID=1546026 RepID=UPI003343445B
MISRRFRRPLAILAVAVVLCVIVIRRKSSGYDYEVPDLERFKGSESQSFSSSNQGYEPFDEIKALLIQSPVVIFSKSYCPHSRFVKALLSEQYKMVPPPIIRELDLDPHGQEIQDALFDISGRRTVPNVFVGGKSLGGGDEMRLLHGQNQLAEAFKNNAGRRFKISRASKN